MRFIFISDRINFEKCRFCFKVNYRKYFKYKKILVIKRKYSDSRKDGFKGVNV